MNREEYLELLRDYLLKVFSKDETNDILRDYEEYFVDAIMEGKEESEIIMSLGSPKKIVKDLIDSNLDSEETTNKLFQNNSEDKYDKIYEKEDPYFVDKVGETCQKGFNVFKRETSHLGKKIKKSNFFNRIGKKIDKTFTVDIQNKEAGKMKKSSKIIQVCLKLMSLFLVFPAIGFVGTLVGFIVFLVGMAIAYIALLPAVIKIFGVLDVSFAGVLFSAMFAIGAEVLAFMVVIFFIKLFISLLKIYINWLKRKNIYINAANKYEENCKVENKVEEVCDDEYEYGVKENCDEFEIDEENIDKEGK